MEAKQKRLVRYTDEEFKLYFKQAEWKKLQIKELPHLISRIKTICNEFKDGLQSAKSVHEGYMVMKEPPQTEKEEWGK